MAEDKMTMAELRRELYAQQYWLRLLFWLVSQGASMNADDIEELIVAHANQHPEQFETTEGVDFDAMQLEYHPACAHVGRRIAGYLRQAEALEARLRAKRDKGQDTS